MERFQFEKTLESRPIENLPEESKEAMARAIIFETLSDEVRDLSLAENSEIINKIIGEENASASLVDNIKAFSEKLAGQEIKVKTGNNAEDMLKNMTTYLGAFVERIKKHGTKESYERIVRESFYSEKEYLNLLTNHIEFEKAELEGRLGFLKDLITDEELEQLATQKNNYVKKCKEIIENKETIH